MLFLALFASQSAVLVLSPILADVAEEFDVSIAVAGQLRIVAAPLAAAVAIAAGHWLARVSPRALLLVGTALIAVGSLASALAPSFLCLAGAQVPMWAGIAIVLAAGIAATAAWSEPERRTRVVAHALAGPPAAWIVGMPLIGLVASIDWRLAFVVVPLPAALLACAAVAARPADTPVAGARPSVAGILRRRATRRWALGELLATAAWVGTLVFSGALFTEVYELSAQATGLVLGGIAVSYLVGNQCAGKWPAVASRAALVGGSLAAALGLVATWAIAGSLWVVIACFAVSAFVAAARTVSGTVFGFAIAGDLEREVGPMRAATTQIGYLVGSLTGGIALGLGGYSWLALAFGGLYVASVVPFLELRRRRVPRALEVAGSSASA